MATPDNLELVVFVGLKLVHHLEKNGHRAGDRFSLESVSSAGNTDCESVCILPLCMGESLLKIEIFGMGILLFFSSEDLIAIWAEE